MKTYMSCLILIAAGCAVEATEQRRYTPKDADLLVDQDVENDGCSELSLHKHHPSCDAVDDEETRRHESTATIEEEPDLDDGNIDESPPADGQSDSDATTDGEDDASLPDNDEIDEEEPAEDTGDDTPPGDPNIVEFRIAAGTGAGSWNTEATMIVAKVGQTIRFINEDTRRHRLHTNGSPCPHGANFEPGETFDCVVTATYDATARGALYDHNDGPSAEVWLMTTNDAAGAGRSFALQEDSEEEACPDHPQ